MISTRMYTLLGRATWAIGKRQLKKRMQHAPRGSRRAGLIGALALGVIGAGAARARTRHSE